MESETKLPANKLETYLERIKQTFVKKPFPKFQNNIDLKNAKELIEASDFLANISKLKQHLRDYNVDDVFNVFKYDKNTPSDIKDPVKILDLGSCSWSQETTLQS